MKAAVALTVAFTALAGPAVASEPQAADEPCAILNNRILGPRSDNRRPIPLMRETATHGFAPACSVPWTTLSPKNDAIPVEACFRGSLLQLPNDSACGAGTGKLWVGTRWVVTSADLAQEKQHAAICQKLETGSWAGTRALTFECQPRTRELSGVDVDAEQAVKKADAPKADPPAPAPAAPKPDPKR